MTTQTIKVYRDLLEVDAQWTVKTRLLLKERHAAMINMIGSPGCGKTALLERTLSELQGRLRLAVLEGDLETTRDAERIQVYNIPVAQLLTGGGCHLEAGMVHTALLDLPATPLDLIVVENVGNLVCPSEFDLGESAKVAVLSITEGEEKPLKYPLLFREAGAVVITKLDLLPHLRYNLPLCLEHIRQVNPQATIFPLSAWTGEGMDAWVNWINDMVRAAGGGK